MSISTKNQKTNRKELNKFIYYESELKVLKGLYLDIYGDYFLSHNKDKFVKLKEKYEKKIIRKMDQILKEIDKEENPIIKQILMLKIDGVSLKGISQKIHYSVSYIKQLLWEYYKK